MTDAPNPFIYGSPDGSRRGRRAMGGPSVATIERVAKSDFSVVRTVLIDIAIVSYAAFIGWAIFVSSSESDAPSPTEAWVAFGFTVLVLLGLLIGFGHFLLQYMGMLGVLYARSSDSGWEVGPRWGFVLRHRARLDRGELLTIGVEELAPNKRGGRNYGKYLWTVRSSSDEVRFRSPVGLSSRIREQVTAWADSHGVSIALAADPRA